MDTRPRTIVSAFIIIATVWVAYSDTLDVPFHFDDIHNVVENPRIKNLAHFSDLSGTRVVGFLSFALNYRLHGLEVRGYHAVNILIHLLNGLLVYFLVRLVFRTPAMVQTSKSYAEWTAIATALVFAAHPIQTQAVTYIVQRFTSLGALFYLVAVICFLQWRLTHTGKPVRFAWYFGSILATVLAMKTKEFSFTLPFMLMLAEAVLFEGPIGQRLHGLIPFLATLLVIPLSRSDAVSETEIGWLRQTTDFTRTEYLFTEFRVILTYLRLILLPSNQNLDYDYRIYDSLSEPAVWGSLVVLVVIAAAGLVLAFSPRIPSFPYKLAGLGVLWYFLTLSVESSIVPIRDVIFEHRLYLPSVGLFLSLTAVLVAAMRPQTRMRTAVLVAVLGSLTTALVIASYQRNSIWKDPVTLWRDVIVKSPNKARGYNGLGLAHSERREWNEAIAAFQQALRLRPVFSKHVST